MTAPALTRDELYSLLPEARETLDRTLERDDIAGLAVYQDADGRRRARVAETAAAPETDPKGGRLIGVFLKVYDTNQRTRAALDYMAEHPDATAYHASRLFNVSREAVYAAIRRERKKAAKKAALPVCPCCGQPMPKS